MDNSRIISVKFCRERYLCSFELERGRYVYDISNFLFCGFNFAGTPCFSDRLKRHIFPSSAFEIHVRSSYTEYTEILSFHFASIHLFPSFKQIYFELYHPKLETVILPN